MVIRGIGLTRIPSWKPQIIHFPTEKLHVIVRQVFYRHGLARTPPPYTTAVSLSKPHHQPEELIFDGQNHSTSRAYHPLSFSRRITDDLTYGLSKTILARSKLHSGFIFSSSLTNYRLFTCFSHPFFIVPQQFLGLLQLTTWDSFSIVVVVSIFFSCSEIFITCTTGVFNFVEALQQAVWPCSMQVSVM